jgi:hypothetical protein
MLAWPVMIKFFWLVGEINALLCDDSWMRVAFGFVASVGPAAPEKGLVDT